MGVANHKKVHNFDTDAQIFTKCCGKVSHEQLSNFNIPSSKKGVWQWEWPMGIVSNNQVEVVESRAWDRLVDLRFLMHRTPLPDRGPQVVPGRRGELHPAADQLALEAYVRPGGPWSGNRRPGGRGQDRSHRGLVGTLLVPGPWAAPGMRCVCTARSPRSLGCRVPLNLMPAGRCLRVCLRGRPVGLFFFRVSLSDVQLSSVQPCPRLRSHIEEAGLRRWFIQGTDCGRRSAQAPHTHMLLCLPGTTSSWIF